MSSELRQASGSYVRRGPGGVIGEGEGALRIDDDWIDVGPSRISWLDVDELRAADHGIELDLWPEGKVEISGLGRRFETFSQELRKARSRARVFGMLAHGVGTPELFEGASLQPSPPIPSQLQLYDTHLTVVPEQGDPWQIALGAVTGLRRVEDPPALALTVDGLPTLLGMLGRRLDAFQKAVAERRDATSRLLEGITGQLGFADGLGVPAPGIRGFDSLLARVTAPVRATGVPALLAAATAPPLLGLVKLLDPEGESHQAAEPLPEHWASFLLVPVRGMNVLELLSGPSAATYVFEAPLASVNRDLQALHFRRAPLALTEAQAELTPTNPHRLALRRLGPLIRLRRATVARLVHNDGWSEALAKAIG